jgi:hypothetical protein
MLAALLLAVVSPPAQAIDSFNSTIVAAPDTPQVSASLTTCAGVGQCAEQELSVALLRGGALIGETPQGTQPVLRLQPGDPQAGDVVSLRVNGLERASYTWDGRPTIESGVVAGSTSISGLFSVGQTIQVTKGTLAEQHAAVTTSGDSYQATFPQPLACNERLIVLTTSPGTKTAGGDYLATGYNRSVPVTCAPAPQPARSLPTIARDGDEIVVRPAPGHSVGARLRLETTRVTAEAGVFTAGEGCTQAPLECDLTGIRRVRAELSARGDHVAIDGVRGKASKVPVVVHARGGKDQITLSTFASGSVIDLGAGDDQAYLSEDGARQAVVCGPGRDWVFLDPADRVGAGCGAHVNGLRAGATVGRRAGGAVHWAAGRLSRPASVQFIVLGMAPPYPVFAQGKVTRGEGPLRAELHMSRRPPSRVRVSLTIRPRGRRGDNVSILFAGRLSAA